jgi:hypothetical protein
MKYRERDKLPLSFFLLGWYDLYAAFFCCALVLAQRARCAAAILLRAALLIVRTGASTDRLVFAHRAFCASEIFRRAAADSVRFDLFGFVRTPVRFRPTKLPITWMTWSRRARSCSSSFSTPARSAMVFPLTLFGITARPYYRSSGNDARQRFGFLRTYSV